MIKIDWKNLTKYNVFVLRFALGLVVGWFGVNMFIAPEFWGQLIPGFVTAVIPVSTAVMINGVIEITLSLALIFGVYTRIAAWILTLHIFGIIFILGYGPIAVRDFGLMLAAVALGLSEDNVWSLGKKLGLKL